MKRVILTAGLCALASLPALAGGPRDTVVSTAAYAWVGDSIVQGEYKAYAVSEEEITGNYKARPGYFMPVEQTWRRKNDLSAYPRLKTPEKLLAAVYNMGLDEMVNAVEADTTLRTGKEWAGVWTRDVSYSIILSMAALQPEASMTSLKRKVNSRGVIVQDTGSGGAWPVSTDRMVWLLAAWEVYKVTGDRAWLEYAYGVGCRSMADDREVVYTPQGTVRGETSFIDWREQSYPRWMQTADIYASEASNTNIVHAAATGILGEMAEALGKKKEAAQWDAQSQGMAKLINEVFYMAAKGYYGMYRYGRQNLLMNPREETLGAALAILYGIADAEQSKTITESVPVTPFGPAIFFPQIADMPNYHNNALWPFVAAYWTLANAKAGNGEGVMQGMGSIVRPAALFATNKENFNLDNGDIYTELNSSNMLWSLSGNIALTQQILFGIHFEKDGLRIAPVVPEALAGTRTLENFPYRGARLNITVSGFGNKIASVKVNGKERKAADGCFLSARELKKGADVVITLNNEPLPVQKVNKTANVKAPLTPVARILTDAATGGDMLQWNPIEYIGSYRVYHNGKRVADTNTTSWPVSEVGEWQVTGISSDGIEGFASEPCYYGPVAAFQLPDEGLVMESAEVSYRPNISLAGYHGKGFREVDHATGEIVVPVEVKAPGRYAVMLRYANGNGPVNTENKCAVRTLTLNGNKAGTVVMPHRGVANWNDWGLTNAVIVNLPAGKSNVGIVFNSYDENMNLHTNHALIDEVLVMPVE